jgi:hypothetical protein
MLTNQNLNVPLLTGEEDFEKNKNSAVYYQVKSHTLRLTSFGRIKKAKAQRRTGRAGKGVLQLY